MIRSALALSSALLALSSATALADAPWSSPVTLGDATGYFGTLATTPAGHMAVVAQGNAVGPLGLLTGALVAAVGDDGHASAPQQLALNGARIASYGSDNIVLAGTLLPAALKNASKAPVELATGRPGAVGKPGAVPGTSGQQLWALAGSPGGVVAFVTGSVTGNRQRIVWERRGGAVRRVLTIGVSERARGATVAIGSHGDVLVVWEDNHRILTRHIGPSGRAGAVHDVGAGVQSSLQARYDDSGRQEVTWASQRVDEGDAVTGATISYTSAARGHGFTRAKVIGRDEIRGSGRYVDGPAVRLVGSGSDSSVLATTVYDGANFRVQEADVVAGAVGAPQTLSPAGLDAVLGDLACARAGGTLVLWRSGVRGADPAGPQRVLANFRPAGQSLFGTPEAVSAPGDVPASPSAAINPLTGASLALFGYLTPQVLVSARPASR